MYKIIGADQKEYGPVTADQLNQWLAEGRVNSQTKVCPAGGSEWKTLGELPEFSLRFNTPPPLTGSPSFTSPSATNTKTSGMAVASLILGILGLVTCGVSALVGLILGIIAMGRIKKNGGALTGHGLALAGTIVSGVFLLLIPLWAAMLLPALARAKQRAQTIACVNNMKQLALAVRIYSSDHTNMPPAATWCDALKPELGVGEKVLQCPAAMHEQRCNYAYNARLDGLEEDKINPQTVLFFETDGGWNVSGGPELMLRKSRHGRIYVVAFADGSVQQLREQQLSTLRWNP